MRGSIKLTPSFYFVLALLFISTSCGLKPAGSNEAASVPNSSLSVYVFSAPWCAECNRELPVLKEKYFTELTLSEQSQVSVSVFVVTGKTPGQAASQEVADEYGNSLGLPFTMLPDKSYKMYRKYFEEGNAIPAAVLLNNNQQAIQLYEAGSTDLNDLFTKIKQNLK